MGVSVELLSQILSGRKTVEGRLRTGKFLIMRKGDKVTLREDVWKDDRLTESRPNRAIVMIEESLFFDSFTDMFKVINFKQVIPTAKDITEALQTYRRFYTKEQETEHGVVALRFSVIKATPGATNVAAAQTV